MPASNTFHSDFIKYYRKAEGGSSQTTHGWEFFELWTARYLARAWLSRNLGSSFRIVDVGAGNWSDYLDATGVDTEADLVVAVERARQKLSILGKKVQKEYAKALASTGQSGKGSGEEMKLTVELSLVCAQFYIANQSLVEALGEAFAVKVASDSSIEDRKSITVPELTIHWTLRAEDLTPRQYVVQPSEAPVHLLVSYHGLYECMEAITADFDGRRILDPQSQQTVTVTARDAIDEKLLRPLMQRLHPAGVFVSFHASQNSLDQFLRYKHSSGESPWEPGHSRPLPDSLDKYLLRFRRAHAESVWNRLALRHGVETFVHAAWLQLVTDGYPGLLSQDELSAFLRENDKDRAWQNLSEDSKRRLERFLRYNYRLSDKGWGKKGLQLAQESLAGWAARVQDAEEGNKRVHGVIACTAREVCVFASFEALKLWDKFFFSRSFAAARPLRLQPLVCFEKEVQEAFNSLFGFLPSCYHLHVERRALTLAQENRADQVFRLRLMEPSDDSDDTRKQRLLSTAALTSQKKANGLLPDLVNPDSIEENSCFPLQVRFKTTDDWRREQVLCCHEGSTNNFRSKIKDLLQGLEVIQIEPEAQAICLMAGGANEAWCRATEQVLNLLKDHKDAGNQVYVQNASRNLAELSSSFFKIPKEQLYRWLVLQGLRLLETEAGSGRDKHRDQDAEWQMILWPYWGRHHRAEFVAALVGRFTKKEVQFIYERLREIGNFIDDAQSTGQLYLASLKQAKTALISRNLSHNIGSHVLSSGHLVPLLPNDAQSRNAQHWVNHIQPSLKQLPALHQYLQTRLDFMAKILHGELPTWSPLFLWRDILLPYFSNLALWNSLLADHNYKAEDIEINVEHEQQEVLCFTVNDAGNTALPEHDPIVNLPGGMVGAHALYTIIENCLRNAAKYGRDQKARNTKKLRLHLQTSKQADNLLHVRLWDNLSSRYKLDDQGQLAREEDKDDALSCVVSRLNSRLISETGQLNPKSFGLQEMRCCAEFLIKGEGDVEDTDRAPLLCKGQKQAAEDSYQQERLAFCFEIHLAQFITIYAASADTLRHETIRHEQSLRSPVERTTPFALVCLDRSQDMKAQLIDLLDLYYVLPFRTLLVAPDETSASELKQNIVHCLTELQNNATVQPQALRHALLNTSAEVLMRRYPVTCRTRLPLLFDHQEASDEQAQAEQAVLQLYQCWLDAKHPRPDAEPWQVLIGIARDDVNAAFQQWKEHETINLEAERTAHFAIYRETEEEGRKHMAGVDYLATGCVAERALVFDNHKVLHGAFGKGYDCSSFAAFCRIGRGQAESLFTEITNLPRSLFAFRYWFLSLVEGALTKVLVADERVLDHYSSKLDNVLFDTEGEDGYAALKATKVDLIVGIGVNSQEPWMVSKRAYDIVRNECFSQRPLWLQSSQEKPTKGLSFLVGQNKNGAPDFVWQTEAPVPGRDFDFIVIHQGLLDEIGSRYELPSSLLRSLRGMGCFVIRTSGRGPKTGHRVEEFEQVPFLEFSQLSQHGYLDPNKIALARTLLSSTGRPLTS